jgi:hypothetical protein
MPSEYHIVRVHDMPHTITVSQRSRIAWVAVGEYTGTYIEAVGPSAGGAARRWIAAACCIGTGKADKWS